MVINTPPPAGRTSSHADIGRSARGCAIAHRAVLGLDYITGLAAQHFAARILVLDFAQKPVGNSNKIGRAHV